MELVESLLLLLNDAGGVGRSFVRSLILDVMDDDRGGMEVLLLSSSSKYDNDDELCSP